MDNGFGTNLEGFLIHGNLSLNPGEIPAINGDGSIEASGTFYIDKLREYNNNNGIDIQNVVFTQNYVEIPFNTPSNINSGTLILNGGISINNTTDSTSLSSGGTITTLGGISIGKKLNVGDIINCNENKIINLSWPTNPLDAANKAYVDSITHGNVIGNFTAGQIIIGGSGGNIVGFPNFIYNENSGLVILDTTYSVNLTSGASITTYGGINIYKTLNVGDIINVNNNKIINLLAPTEDLDAVNKFYVDNLFDSIGSGSGGSLVHLNFTSGQILIGGTGNSIIGRDSFIYTDNGIYIYNTTNATGLGTGGALTITGGLSVDKNVYIGGQLNVNLNNITSVATPINPYDAVNKIYVDSLFNSINTGGGGGGTGTGGGQQFNYENSFILDNNVTVPTAIPLLLISPDNILSFITYIYVNVSNIDTTIVNCLYTIYSFYDGTKWIYNTKFTGFISEVNFLVLTDGNQNAVVNYTNTNLSGVSTIKYYVQEDITVNPSNFQYNYNLSPTTGNNYLNFLSFLYNDIVSLKIHVYITIDTSAAFFIFDLLFKEDRWVMNYDRIGDDIGIDFRMTNTSNVGIIQYKNTNGRTVTARFKEYKILDSYSSIQLYNNTYNGVVNRVQILNTDYVQLYIYVEKPGINQYAFYTIEAFKHLNNWYINSSFIGDYLNVTFHMNSSGYLTYSNPDLVNLTYIKVMIMLPNQNIPLPVISGGTGNTFLEPYAVLIGNGHDPIINTTEFIYKDCTLHMYCKDAQIVIHNTTDASGLGTGGNLTLYGGASINKSLYVGNQLHVNNVNITPSPGDLNERAFYANNNQIIEDPITDFFFDSFIVKSFIAQITITIVLASSQLNALVILKGINTPDGWKLNTEFIGDNTGLKFYCDNSGQVHYTSTNLNNWLSTKIKFRANTTSI